MIPLALVSAAALLVPVALIIGGINGVSLVGIALALAGMVLTAREGA